MAQKIAIIGGGFSGVMVAIHLLQKATYPVNILCIDYDNFLQWLSINFMNYELGITNWE